MIKAIKGLMLTLAIASVTLSSQAISKESLKSLSGFATFTTDNVNLRQGPSTSEPYLIYLDGEELYFNADNIAWSNELGGMRINGQLVQPDHSKLQGRLDETLPVIGSEGEWIKLDYLGHEVWTMKKFVKTSPVSPLTTSMTFSPNGYNSLNVTGTEDGSPAFLFQESGMDEDQGFYIGHVEGNAVIFDHFIPFQLVVEQLPDRDMSFKKSPDGNGYVFTLSPKKVLKGYNVPDVKTFDSGLIEAMTQEYFKLPDNKCLILVNSPIGPQLI